MQLASELGGSTTRNWEVQPCNLVSRVVRSNGSELGGGTMQNCQANWGVGLAGELADGTRPNGAVNWEVLSNYAVTASPDRRIRAGGPMAGPR